LGNKCGVDTQTVNKPKLISTNLSQGFFLFLLYVNCFELAISSCLQRASLSSTHEAQKATERTQVDVLKKE